MGEVASLKYEPMLSGWDDEKVYFTDEACKTWCVSDHPELVARLMEMCREYFAQRAGVSSSEGDEVDGQWESH